MEDGPPIFRQDITCPALLIELTTNAPSDTGLSPLCRRTFQTVLLMRKLMMALGCSPFARRYWGNLG